MLHAVFDGHGVFIVLATLLSSAVGLVVFRKSPPETERPLFRGLFAAAVTAVLSLTLWTTGSPVELSLTCTINRDLVEPFTTEQGLLNAGLFVPVGFLGVLAHRKVLGVMAFGVLLTATIETLQAVLPFLGRGCDTSDLIMNSLGGIAGALAGWLITLLERPRGSFLHRWEARSTYAASAALALMALAFGFVIEPDVVDRTLGIGRASDAQEDAMRDAVRQAFDGDIGVSDVSFGYGEDDTGTIMAQLAGDGGSAELRWPSRRGFQVILDAGTEKPDSGYLMPGVTTRPRNAEQARSIARAYAERHAAWGLKDGARPATYPVGEKAELGWVTSWRRSGADGILMPMRLDVQIDRNGRVTQLTMNDVPDVKVAKPRITRDAAVTKVLGPDSNSDSAEVRAGTMEDPYEVVLLAAQNGSRWVPAWYITQTLPNLLTDEYVDAITGETFDPTR
ncbi:VanZ family protein [Streptomyces sp. NPDC046203]|uniref:VanZ family protein n=1 Tax=Streptomyces sp. NPDC046203 TaxID=3154602 RepID=UPI0033E6B6FA